MSQFGFVVNPESSLLSVLLAFAESLRPIWDETRFKGLKDIFTLSSDSLVYESCLSYGLAQIADENLITQTQDMVRAMLFYT